MGLGSVFRCCLGRARRREEGSNGSAFNYGQIVPAPSEPVELPAEPAPQPPADDLGESSGSSCGEISSNSSEAVNPEQMWMKQARKQERQRRRRRRARRRARKAAEQASNPKEYAEDVQTGRKPALYERYSISESLGAGSYSSVSRCEDLRGGTSCALKTVLRKKAPSAQQLQEEIEIMRLLSGLSDDKQLPDHVQHGHIVRLLEVFEEDSRVHLVIELCNGGELFEALMARSDPLADKDASRLARQMASAVQHLHAKSIAHRDVKPENFMLQESVAKTGLEGAVLKMIDFGLSRRFLPGQPMTTTACTIYYVAPEVLQGRYTEACDIWSLGASIYVLLCKQIPFGSAGLGEAQIARMVKEGNFDREHAAWSAASRDAKDIVSKLFVIDAACRPTSEQVMQHRWLQ
eukprot:TRINITY_DN39774_c0_g1_i1.p1 TRINITY_DN39774_c0_g1~~TRINITY_DN39774_c0_g1_i1.p1  ORF type:complete len:406 (-),score=113.02 TRINITY_DN39774_c0_g1_i1:54-1271(-)